MKLHDIIALTIKMSGLILLVISVASLPNLVNIISSNISEGFSLNSLFLISPFLVTSGISLIFIFLPYKISNQYVLEEEISVKNNEKVNHLQIIGIRLLGLLLLFWSISDMVFHFFNYLMLKEDSGVSLPISGYNSPLIIATIVELVFALFLLNKSKTISEYLELSEKLKPYNKKNALGKNTVFRPPVQHTIQMTRPIESYNRPASR